jgi:anthranilate phosphoribosyltransferase
MDELRELLRGVPLDESSAERLFTGLLAGRLDDAQIGAALGVLASRGPTVDELVGGARAMRASVVPVPFEPWPDERLVDTCGTGGAAKTFNVSTAAALVAAGADERVRVAKHGNRSRTGRGSAEVLALLGVNVDASPQTQARCLREAGVCFCFAIHHHPAMRYAAGPRRSLGVPTVFNLLGPLTNPAGAARQLIGVYEPGLVDLMGRTLAALGADRGMVVHGREGLDEIGLGAATDAALIEQGAMSRAVIDPSSLGLSAVPSASLTAGDASDAARVISAVLGGELGGRREIVVLNAAAALVVCDVAGSLADGVAMAGEAIDSGRAGRTLARLIAVSQER